MSKLFENLGTAVNQLRLHAHLLGMGNADFWLRIMIEYLPRVTMVNTPGSWKEIKMTWWAVAQ
jgi:hypothetical protein